MKIFAWSRVADTSLVYVDRGITRGMAYGSHVAMRGGLSSEFRKLGFKNPLRPSAPKIAANKILIDSVAENLKKVAGFSTLLSWDQNLDLMKRSAEGVMSKSALLVSPAIALRILSSNELKPFFVVEQNASHFLAGSLCVLHSVPVVVSNSDIYDAALVSIGPGQRVTSTAIVAEGGK